MFFLHELIVNLSLERILLPWLQYFFQFQAFFLQLRPISRLITDLRRLSYTVIYQDLEDLDFDTLLPLFTLLAHTASAESGFSPRLDTILLEFAEFLAVLSNRLSANNVDPVLPRWFASTVLPTAQRFLQAPANHPRQLTLTFLRHVAQFAVNLSGLASRVPCDDQKYVISCLVGCLQVISASTCIFRELDCHTQEAFLRTALTITFAVKSRISWSICGPDLLSILEEVFGSTHCPISGDLLESLLENCILCSYGDGAILACHLLSSVCNSSRPKSASQIPCIFEWLEKVINLYLQPIFYSSTFSKWDYFHIKLANAVLKTVRLLNYEHCSTRFIELYTAVQSFDNIV